MVAVLKADANGHVAPFIARTKLSTRTTTYNNGEIVYREGELSKRVFQIIRGAARTLKQLPGGRRQVLAFYLSKDIFGLSLGSSYSHSVSTIADTTLRSVSREGLDLVARSNAFVDKELRKVLAQEIRRAGDHLLLLGQKDAYEKVLAFLLEMDRRHRSDKMIRLLMDRRDIANYLGLTMETVARIISYLRDLGAISFPRNPRTLVVDQKRLHNLTSQRERDHRRKLY